MYTLVISPFAFWGIAFVSGLIVGISFGFFFCKQRYQVRKMMDITKIHNMHLQGTITDGQWRAMLLARLNDDGRPVEIKE